LRAAAQSALQWREGETTNNDMESPMNLKLSVLLALALTATATVAQDRDYDRRQDRDARSGSDARDHRGNDLDRPRRDYRGWGDRWDGRDRRYRGQFLGSARLSHRENDRNVLSFGRCRDGVDAIRLHVERGNAEIETVWVRFANGGVDRLKVRDRIGDGRSSRWIDLRGRDRCVQSIGIIGDTESSFDRARVEIWAR
jgi:hypothetical protein